ncbi:hypothetical protein [Algoriphagus winogradskyi]|uniref:Uncharacterized protein n=1 Tax=Algoriphagus winogradskyi TaxID=237017 RepID=A0ABY1NMK2_9BACT|nr:hypothetical protein [Algoriphagus winogradskyi]SMP13696.1 hypothetical protein SAMN06265367_102251 [Algoriphagus winogradskyi]
MITSLFSQKNICAALGLVMALTIVWQAKVETNLAKHTALIDYTEPTYNTGKSSNSDNEKVYEFKKIRTADAVL